ncbi:hypothetical protein CHARACLAT_010751 [Characodon lateralis]|uniref:Uncharacterized protein n=1 Tax=Characodon lateralis TaxID=208331 RepID=A0ABU7ETT4_9TELE|nr:hypothetical protein [Characodon lateralis]
MYLKHWEPGEGMFGLTASKGLCVCLRQVHTCPSLCFLCQNASKKHPWWALCLVSSLPSLTQILSYDCCFFGPRRKSIQHLTPVESYFFCRHDEVRNMTRMSVKYIETCIQNMYEHVAAVIGNFNIFQRKCLWSNL